MQWKDLTQPHCQTAIAVQMYETRHPMTQEDAVFWTLLISDQRIIVATGFGRNVAEALPLIGRALVDFSNCPPEQRGNLPTYYGPHDNAITQEIGTLPLTVRRGYYYCQDGCVAQVERIVPAGAVGRIKSGDGYTTWQGPVLWNLLGSLESGDDADEHHDLVLDTWYHDEPPMRP